MNVDGDISNYYSDFFVQLDKQIVIVETKGQADLDVPFKMNGCSSDAQTSTACRQMWNMTFYVDKESFERYKPILFRQLFDSFGKYKERV